MSQRNAVSKSSSYNPLQNEARGITFKRGPMKNFFVLLWVTVFQLISFYQVAYTEKNGFNMKLTSMFGIYIAVEWAYFFISRIILRRKSFELEIIAFLLSGISLTIVASVYPDLAKKQLISILLGLLVFFFMVWFLGDINRVMKVRIPLAVASVGLLAVNLVLAKAINGALNWITIGPISIQPSELVKIAFVFVGGATLEKLQSTRHLYVYVAFACACIGALFLMRDFGTACIFFFTFLILAFMRSGDIRTIILSVTAAVLGAFMIIRFKPYVKRRFSTWRHVWEFADTTGYQQTRVLIGIASGGLFGVGIGNGYLRNVSASTTDLIFGVICEEWGLILGIVIILIYAGLAVYTLKNSAACRSAFYSITACAAAGMMLFQVCLNVFGITDIIPLTGVTLPFISRGGSSMICSWGLLAFIKAADVRTYPKIRREMEMQ